MGLHCSFLGDFGIPKYIPTHTGSYLLRLKSDRFLLWVDGVWGNPLSKNGALSTPNPKSETLNPESLNPKL